MLPAFQQERIIPFLAGHDGEAVVRQVGSVKSLHQCIHIFPLVVSAHVKDVRLGKPALADDFGITRFGLGVKFSRGRQVNAAALALTSDIELDQFSTRRFGDRDDSVCAEIVRHFIFPIPEAVLEGRINFAPIGSFVRFVNRYHEGAGFEQRQSSFGGSMKDIDFEIAEFPRQSQVDPNCFAQRIEDDAGCADAFQMFRVEFSPREQKDFYIVTARKCAQQFCSVAYQAANVGIVKNLGVEPNP